MIKIAVSACLLGHNVRYDGGSKHIPVITDVLAKQFQIVPVCPESEAGFGTPRPPMHLIQKANKTVAILVDKPHTNLTPQLHLQAESWLKQNGDISGLIVKARSPSCAYKTAPLAKVDETTSGLFTQYIQRQLPHICIIDEVALNDDVKLSAFIASLRNL